MKIRSASIRTPGGSAFRKRRATPANAERPLASSLRTSTGEEGKSGWRSIATPRLIAGSQDNDPTRARTAKRSPACGVTWSSRTGADSGRLSAMASFSSRSETGRVSDASAPRKSSNPPACCRRNKPRNRSSTEAFQTHLRPEGRGRVTGLCYARTTVAIPLVRLTSAGSLRTGNTGSERIPNGR
jgi:hypothetical protein